MRKTKITLIAILATGVGIILGCKKNPEVQSSILTSLPKIATKALKDINSSSVISGGELNNDSSITDKGIIWGTDSSTLTVSSINKIVNGAGGSTFIDTIQNLKPNTNYFLRAYAINSSGIAYGATIKFFTQPIVYVAGYSDISAAYWKNNKLYPLPNGTLANSVYAVGNDVYVAGENNTGHNIRAIYWKNGIDIQLTYGVTAALANSIFVAGKDVYVAGYELNNYGISVAKYWKNGVAVSLSEGSIYNSGILNSIYVVGNDVYAAGFIYNRHLEHQMATYWKNGTPYFLSDTTNSIGSASSIIVSGNDIYVCGYEKSSPGLGGITLAKYWKNGVAVSLTDGSEYADAYSIFVNNNDVYVTGYEYSGNLGYAKYWKNGIPFTLTDGKQNGNSRSIYVVGNDVYVAGAEGNYDDARCWKNGVKQPLEIIGTYSGSTSVFVQ